jgi:PhnB protein
MASVATYLNFDGTTEQAFEFYRSVFGTEYIGAGIMRMGDVPAGEGEPETPESMKQLVMHVSLPILGGHVLMGTDFTEEMGMGKLIQGNAMHVSLLPDSREEADRLFTALSDGGKVLMPIADQFWGDYYGSFVDKFGTSWMVDYNPNAS